jgi:DNA-binding PadR family transcriptional regulator
MYSDNTLTPKEAVRLCALGTLSGEPMAYGALAQSVRHFIDRVQGPSLDVLGTSVELLKYEGLVEITDGDGDQETLQVTDKGRSELHALLTANIRASDSDLNKLIEALKFRFLHLLDAEHQHQQTDLLVERTEVELSRHLDLRQHFQGDAGFLLQWLERDITELEARLEWLEQFRDTLGASD